MKNEEIEKALKKIEKMILDSRIFKLDQEKKFGIFCLTPGEKAISKKRYDSYERKVIRNIIVELTTEINIYLQGPHVRHPLDSVLKDFENEFVAFLKQWDFTLKDLDPHSTKLIATGKKVLKRNLSRPERNMTKFDIKTSFRKRYLAQRIWEILKSYTSIKDTNIDYYAAHLLVACEIEADSYKRVYDKISQARYRYKATSAI